jgi:hypothetical protein
MRLAKHRCAAPGDSVSVGRALVHCREHRAYGDFRVFSATAESARNAAQNVFP